jgi:biopolymer transport protein ExbD
MRQTFVFQPAAPIGELNVTPLIDVLLVLIVMLVITIPIQTHAVKLDLPTCAKCPLPEATVNTISVSPADKIAWNGIPVSKRTLSLLIRQTQQMQPTPELHLRPEPKARYGTVDEVLAIIKREHVQKFGFVGNEAYADL